MSDKFFEYEEDDGRGIDVFVWNNGSMDFDIDTPSGDASINIPVDVALAIAHFIIRNATSKP